MPYIKIADILDQLATPVDEKPSAAEQKESDDQLSKQMAEYIGQLKADEPDAKRRIMRGQELKVTR